MNLKSDILGRFYPFKTPEEYLDQVWLSLEEYDFDFPEEQMDMNIREDYLEEARASLEKLKQHKISHETM
jgi:hypothetical protein